MTRHARAWFFAALATLLGPFVLPENGATTATEIGTAVAPAPVEQEEYAVADAAPIVLPASTSDRFPEASPGGAAPAPAETLPLRPVTAAAGADHPGLRGARSFLTLHPARGPPSIS